MHIGDYGMILLMSSIGIYGKKIEEIPDANLNILVYNL